MRRAAKKDDNHGELAKTLTGLGCSVVDLSNAGIAGWPDVALGVVGVTALVEFKNPTTRYGRMGLNGNQRAFVRDWCGGPVYVVSTPDECVALVQNLRKAA